MKQTGINFLLLLTTILCACTAFAAELPKGSADSVSVHSYTIDFRLNSWAIDSTFAGNAVNMHRLHHLAEQARTNPLVRIDSLKVSGYASPDGSLPKNKELSLRRAVSLRNYLNQQCGFADSLMSFGATIVPWQMFREIVSASNYPWRNQALSIMRIGSDNSAPDNTRRMNRLKKLANGRAWNLLKSEVLPQLRNSTVVSFVVNTLQITDNKDTIREDTLSTSAQSEVDSVTPAPCYDSLSADSIQPAISADAPAASPFTKSWRLLTNALEWGLLISNIEGEWDFSEHWSLNL